jgi:DNA-directed RNA polymerase sigma subunit (sigma70/sigma32)
VQLTQKEYNKLLSIAKNICKTDFVEDLLHEALFVCLKYPPEKMEFIKKDGKLFFFVARIMANMYHSKTSQYYYRIARFYDKHTLQDCNKMQKFIFTNDTKQQDKIELIEMLLDELYWYDRELFKLYYFGEIDGNKYTLSSLANKTGISRRSIFTTIKNVKTYIKKRLDEIRRVDKIY